MSDWSHTNCPPPHFDPDGHPTPQVDGTGYPDEGVPYGPPPQDLIPVPTSPSDGQKDKLPTGHPRRWMC